MSSERSTRSVGYAVDACVRDVLNLACCRTGIDCHLRASVCRGCSSSSSQVEEVPAQCGLFSSEAGMSRWWGECGSREPHEVWDSIG